MCLCNTHRALRVGWLATVSVPHASQSTNHTPGQTVVKGQRVAVRPPPLPTSFFLFLLWLPLLFTILCTVGRSWGDQAGGVKVTTSQVCLGAPMRWKHFKRRKLTWVTAPAAPPPPPPLSPSVRRWRATFWICLLKTETRGTQILSPTLYCLKNNI